MKQKKNNVRLRNIITPKNDKSLSFLVHGFIRKDMKLICWFRQIAHSFQDMIFNIYSPIFADVCVCWHGCFIWTSFARVLCVFAPWLRGPFGRCSIDLSKFEREKTHRFWQELEDNAGTLHLLLTISGTTSSETISDLSSYEENPREKANIEARYVSDTAAYFFWQLIYFYRNICHKLKLENFQTSSTRK